MGVELRVVAVLTRFPPNWTTVQSQVACDMCSEAYPPRVAHIQMLQRATCSSLQRATVVKVEAK